MQALYETTEATMIEAHKAGMAYWQRNRPHDADSLALTSLARSCGWHGEDNVAWLAGFYAAKRRDQNSGHYDDCDCRMCHGRRLAY